ncbi:MAG: hypothetical protein V1880_00865 [Patescibacteria group bacterium]
MFKFTRFLSIFILALVLAPAVLADNDQPVRIKSAVVETEYSRVVGQAEICNSAPERVRYTLDVKNLTINSIYKRNLSVAGNTCETVTLSFKEDFSDMSNVDDKIVMVAKRVQGLWSQVKYDFSNSYSTKVVKGERDYADCDDQTVEDGVFDACDMDFIYHTPSGLRIKVLKHNPEYVDLKLTYLEWGGIKEMRIYKGRTKKIRSNYSGQFSRVELTNVYGENKDNTYLKIESAS